MTTLTSIGATTLTSIGEVGLCVHIFSGDWVDRVGWKWNVSPVCVYMRMLIGELRDRCVCMYVAYTVTFAQVSIMVRAECSVLKQL